MPTDKENSKISETPESIAAAKKQADRDNQRKSIYRVGGVALVGTTAYSLYKLGKLQDTIPHERLYVTSAILGGAFLGVQGIGMWNEPSQSAKNISKVGGVALLGGIGYALSRSLFNQNVNKSLLIGGLSVVGVVVLYNSIFPQAPAQSKNDANPPIQSQSQPK
jgi:hypothetical protein